MTVREIARSAASLLQADDIEELLVAEDVNAEDDADVKALVRCVNLAVSELAGNGFSRDASATAEAADGVIPFAALSPAPIKITAVRKNGVCVNFAVDGRGIAVDADGTYEVRYSPAPPEYGLDDETELAAFCPSDAAACLAARNYCLVTGRTDDASVWDQMYERHAELFRLTRRASLPTRKWK